MVKITDVARHAGVSPSTVSYVLSGKRSISEETQRRVRDSIQALGYRPHAGARALASNRSNVIALVIPLRSGIHVPVVMQFAVSVVTTARECDHDVLLLTQQEGDEDLRRVVDSSLADGVIVMDVQMHDPRIRVLRSLDRPSVLIGFPTEATGLTCIDLDFTAAGEVCVDHLAGLGHRCVGLIGSPPEVYERETGFAYRTEDGFEAAARRHDMTSTVHPCEATPAAAEEMVGLLLREHPDLTAVVVHNEPIVEPVVAAFQRAGRRVPEDLAVVAICPDELAERAPLPLTSVAIPAEEVGQRAVELLMAQLEGRDVPAATLLRPRLTPRSSTAPRAEE
ncbi:LacI family DNA-binding transcriptional regulator [Micromonospora deserti]|uniref:LacI family transcriptional regulator n=1 Tax=Micromonospora deserti TaxID=2070366 RepID=A0A2W2DQ17_9ACTN|nr:LacI family DNA-binding transcriptional regulator [Micromonospora deserti]PZG01788.1 LacI family transcriptional regulator [Micromonospora deserti]